MDAAYGARYRDLYERHWWWRARERLILERLEHRRPDDGFGPILDIGCGDGLLLEKLAAFGQPEGLEADADLVSEERRRLWTIHLRPLDASFSPGKRYGLVLLLDVLEHLADDAAALRHVHGLLAPGGTLLLTVPALPALWTGHDAINHHHRRYLKRTLGAPLTAAGFSVHEMRYFFHWMVLPKLAVRAAEALHRRPPKPAALPAPPINGAAYALCRLEQATWGRLPVPVGSSLIAVARAVDAT